METCAKQKQAPPQELCKKCGKCCRCAISFYSKEELENTENEKIKLFLSLFKKYDSLDEAKSVDEKSVNNLLDTLKTLRPEQSQTPEIWYCVHLGDDNKCQIFEDRPDFCRNFPENGWIITPENCGYKGWQFEQKEAQKKIIRKLKEQLLILKTTHTKSLHDDMIIKDIEMKIKNKIAKYKKYGAEDW